MASSHHRLDYTEFTVTDLDRATRFYGDAFGWAFNDYGPGYAGIRADPAEQYPEVGGFVVADEVTAGGPLSILYSDDLGASEAAVVAAGGTVVEPAYAFPGGRRFHFRDPEGNVLAVWSAS
ncbi:VOC family protein [Amycolatopsis sp. NPDC004368]